MDVNRLDLTHCFSSIDDYKRYMRERKRKNTKTENKTQVNNSTATTSGSVVEIDIAESPIFFQCNECSKSFKNKTGYEEHILSHNESKVHIIKDESDKHEAEGCLVISDEEYSENDQRKNELDMGKAKVIIKNETKLHETEKCQVISDGEDSISSTEIKDEQRKLFVDKIECSSIVITNEHTDSHSCDKIQTSHIKFDVEQSKHIDVIVETGHLNGDVPDIIKNEPTSSPNIEPCNANHRSNSETDADLQSVDVESEQSKHSAFVINIVPTSAKMHSRDKMQSSDCKSDSVVEIESDQNSSDMDQLDNTETSITIEPTSACDAKMDTDKSEMSEASIEEESDSSKEQNARKRRMDKYPSGKTKVLSKKKPSLQKKKKGKNDSCMVPKLKTVPCPMCSKLVANKKKGLLRHIKIYHTKLFDCSMCPEKFTTLRRLNIHKRIHAGEPVYKCLECEKCFLSQAGLKMHEKSHSKPFKCPECDCSFQQNHGILNHIAMHKRDNHFKCPHCLRCFFTKVECSEHTQIHSKEDDMFKCAHCEIYYETAEQCRAHEETHKVKRPEKSDKGYAVRCEWCGEDFETINKHRQHQKKHGIQTNQSYEAVCPLCSERLPTLLKLHNHLEDAHDEDERNPFFKKMTLINEDKPCDADLEIEGNGENSHSNNAVDCDGETIGDKKLFYCDMCSRHFDDRIRLEEHNKRTHSGDLPFKCSFCDRGFTMLCDLTIHQQKHTGLRPFHCPHCPKAYPTRNRLINHIWLHTVNKPFVCLTCSKAFSSQAAVKVHLMKEHGGDGETPFKCDQCDWKSWSRTRLSKHKKLQHSGLDKESISMLKNPFACRYDCGKRFSSRPNREEHERKHTGEKPLLCTICGKGFRSRSSLTSHERICAVNQARKMQFMTSHATNYLTSTPSSTKTSSSITSSDARQFDGAFESYMKSRSSLLCAHCGKSYSSKRGLVWHLKAKHQGEMQYSCDQCEKKFPVKADLTRHIRKVHSMEVNKLKKRQFQCNQCGKRVTTQSILDTHKRIAHSGGPDDMKNNVIPRVSHPPDPKKPYKCRQCDDWFSCPAMVLDHERTHTGEKPYECQYCDKRFGRSHLLLKHEKKMHVSRGHLKKSEAVSEPAETYNYGKDDEDELGAIIKSDNPPDPVKPFKCRFCDLWCRSPFAVRTHEITHTGGEKQYICQYCDAPPKWFRLRHLWLKHEREHRMKGDVKLNDSRFEAVKAKLDLKPHKCSFCGQGFKFKGARHKHEQIHAKAGDVPKKDYKTVKSPADDSSNALMNNDDNSAMNTDDKSNDAVMNNDDNSTDSVMDQGDTQDDDTDDYE